MAVSELSLMHLLFTQEVRPPTISAREAWLRLNVFHFARELQVSSLLFTMKVAKNKYCILFCVLNRNVRIACSLIKTHTHTHTRVL